MRCNLPGNLLGDKVIAGVGPHVVAVLLQLFEKGSLLGVKQMSHGAVPSHVGIEAGHKAAAARHTDWILTEGVAEGYGLRLGEGIQKRGYSCRISQMVKSIPAHLVRVEYDNIWSFFRHVCPFLKLFPFIHFIV